MYCTKNILDLINVYKLRISLCYSTTPPARGDIYDLVRSAAHKPPGVGFAEIYV